MESARTRVIALVVIALLALIGCSPADTTPPTPTPQPVASTITVHNWVDGMPQAILDAFTAEYGVQINYVGFASSSEAEANIEAGAPFDVVILSNDFIGEVLDRDLLAELNHNNIPNMRNIAPSFRDLSYDPGNRFSVPYSWGTTGLVVRTDLFEGEVTSWNDLWRAADGQAGVWDDQRSMIGAALRSLGYSANSSSPEELQAALARLLELRERGIFLEAIDPWTSVPALADGTVTIALGWAYDALAGREVNETIQYVIPSEGTLLWLENWVVPANSPNKATAELFINFMHRPEIAAQFSNEMYYAVANDLSETYVNEDLLNDSAVFPTEEMLQNAELLLPLEPETDALYDRIWAEFMGASAGA